ncbi:MAG: YopX family protein [Kiritimatiellaeota bacterium]|nr:YopX family protein [Kiritimatiellota bacterium]
MREILFRGKRLDNGEWAEGDILTIGDARFIRGKVPEGAFHHTVRVNPATIGQFTGLVDRDGLRIFVGDVVGFIRDGGDVLDDLFPVLDLIEDGYRMLAMGAGRVQVVGNAHDDPELMKEDKG